jgi:hypothetical protein
MSDPYRVPSPPVLTALEQVVQPHLDADERLEWVGQPARRVRFTGSDFLMVPFSLMWAGFAVFWNWGVWHSNAPFFFRLFGMPFLVMGCYVTVGRFVVAAMARASTIYALTNQRVLCISGRRNRSLQSLPLTPDLAMTLKEAGATGTISFGNNPSRSQDAKNAARWGFSAAVDTFEDIADAQRVFELARSSQKALASNETKRLGDGTTA